MFMDLIRCIFPENSIAPIQVDPTTDSKGPAEYKFLDFLRFEGYDKAHNSKILKSDSEK